MRAIGLFALLAAACARSVTATCYEGGFRTAWDEAEKREAIGQLNSVCKEFDGKYVARQSWGPVRRETHQGHTIVNSFKVINWQNHESHLSVAYCVEKFRREIELCQSGGHSSYADFTFESVDPA